MRSNNNKSGGSIILIILVALTGLFFFKVDFKGFFESQQMQDNVAYLKTKVSEMFATFKLPTGTGVTTGSNQPLSFPSIDPAAISKMLQIPALDQTNTNSQVNQQTQNQGGYKIQERAPQQAPVIDRGGIQQIDPNLLNN